MNTLSSACDQDRVSLPRTTHPSTCSVLMMPPGGCQQNSLIPDLPSYSYPYKVPTQTHFPFLSSCISSFIHYKSINSTEILWKLGKLIFNCNLYHHGRSFKQSVLCAPISGSVWHTGFPWFWNKIQASLLPHSGDKAHTQVLQTVHPTKYLNLTGKKGNTLLYSTS